MQEFHAHQWAVREGWRQVDNNFIYKIRRDGANFEFANDGHENTDQFLTLAVPCLAGVAGPTGLAGAVLGRGVPGQLPVQRPLPGPQPEARRLLLPAQCPRRSGGGTSALNPEYKVNLLAGEAEVRRRLWKVFQIGQPEEPPQIDSESLAFQGYYYLRPAGNRMTTSSTSSPSASRSSAAARRTPASACTATAAACCCARRRRWTAGRRTSITAW